MDGITTHSSSLGEGDVVGMLILKELKLIRQDMKIEIRSLREEIKHGCGEKHAQHVKKLIDSDNLTLDDGIAKPICMYYGNEDSVSKSLKNSQPVVMLVDSDSGGINRNISETTGCRTETNMTPILTHYGSIDNVVKPLLNLCQPSNSTMLEGEQGNSLISKALSPMKSTEEYNEQPNHQVNVEFICEQIQGQDLLCEPSSELTEVSDNRNTRRYKQAVKHEFNHEEPLSSGQIQHTKRKFQKKKFKQPPEVLRILDKNPYKCEHCTENFAFKPKLKQHLHTIHEEMNSRANLESKSFYCLHCQQSYTNKNAYEVHRRAYTGERPFKCIECGTGFILKTYLNHHLYNVHGDMKVFSRLLKRKRKSF